MKLPRKKLLSVGLIILMALASLVVSGCQAGDIDSAGSDAADSNQIALDEQIIKAVGAMDDAALAAALQEGGSANAESSPGRPALFLATSRGYAEGVRMLLDNGADVDADSADGAILVKAAVVGSREIAEALLDAGADMESIGKAWSGGDGTALWAAAENKNDDVARLLIERGADVNAATASGTSVLMIAAGNNMADIVTLLLESGAEIDHQAANGWTALHGAALHPFNNVSSPEAASVLIAHGAELNIENDEGQTPLDIALPDVAELLREAGASE